MRVKEEKAENIVGEAVFCKPWLLKPRFAFQSFSFHIQKKINAMRGTGNLEMQKSH